MLSGGCQDRHNATIQVDFSFTLKKSDTRTRLLAMPEFMKAGRTTAPLKDDCNTKCYFLHVQSDIFPYFARVNST